MEDVFNSQARRRFIRIASSGFGLTFLAAAGVKGATPADRTDIEEKQAAQLQQDEEAKRFVVAAHSDIDTVRSTLEANPLYANAAWNWGGGDWETALGGASHVGRADIAELLIERGARKDIFWAAMAGELRLVKTMLDGMKNPYRHRGPHRISLFYHAALSGNVALAEFLAKTGFPLEQNELLGAVRMERVEMAEWIMRKGMNDISYQDPKGRTILEIAESKNNPRIVELLKRRGKSLSFKIGDRAN